MSSRRRLATSLDRSHVGTTLRDAIDTSTAVRVGRRIATPIRVTYRDSGGVDRWRRTAVTLAVVRAIQATIATATKTAAITRAGRTVAAWTRASFLYRWLTKEPEPEVIVIDLRETVTVGPIIALLDALVDAFAPSVRRSSLVDTLAATGQAIEAAPVRALGLVVLVATVLNLLVTLVLAGFDPAGVALRILVIGAAAVGTRVTLSWAELRQTRAGRGEPYSTTAKRKFVDVLKAYFRWRVAEFGADDWEPPVEFQDETPENPADYFTREERQRLYDAALGYKSVPSYNNLSPEERDRWKAYISQVLGKPKDEVRPADFKKLNRSWKIPSLIAATLDAGLRPCEIERMQLSWLRLDKLELHVPKDRAAKNREHWHVSIRERTAQALDRWVEQRENKEKYDGRGEVWLNQNGNPYTSRTLNDLLDNLLDAADIDQTNRKLVWYSFRHSTGQYLPMPE